jgi:hypothetical protein
MRRNHREGDIPSSETRQPPPQNAAGADGGADAPAYNKNNVEVGAGTATLARLVRFGLTITGKPLLKPERERT